MYKMAAISKSKMNQSIAYSGIQKFEKQKQLEPILTATISKGNFDEVNAKYMQVIDDLPRKNKKRLYYLFIESVQNVIRHAAGGEEKESVFSLMKEKDAEKYYLITGNPIPKSQSRRITSRIDLLNNLRHETIDRFYFHLLDSLHFSQDGGAGLGFLQMKRKSNYSDMEYMTEDLGNACYFYLILQYQLQN